ncbi:MAG: DUF4440 domain-containing protein [Lewinellaceae bacterium]|nr:DUF4440 domain-containing protein [Lewinellaceae bacterium]
MKYFSAIVTILLVSASLTGQTDRDVEAVKALLISQSEAWNRGDIDAFMEGYWKSDKLLFTSGGGITEGWQNTLDRYKKGYPDRAAMGKLTFDILNVTKRSKKIISLNGKFTLEREKDRPTGYFLLLFQKIKGQWVIVADCTAG